MVALIFVAAFIRGEGFVETLKFALVLLVAAIPVALPAVLSVSMAVGAVNLAKSAADIVLTSPGLSVIIDAIKESRKIFQSMNSYAIYRIAEIMRVLFFITLSILFLNFYPVTALMIVLLAILNDVPIMTIAYDNVRYHNEPEKWDMRQVLCMATLLGVIGVIFSFGLFPICGGSFASPEGNNTVFYIPETCGCRALNHIPES